MAVYYIWAYRLFGLILRLHVEDGVRRFVPIIFLLASHGDDDTGYTAAAGDHVLIEAYYRGRPTFCIVLARPVSSEVPSAPNTLFKSNTSSNFLLIHKICIHFIFYSCQ